MSNLETALPDQIAKDWAAIKEQDGENDKASNLNREDVFWLAIGLPKPLYADLFGGRPPRPEKGGIVTTGHDFTETHELMPHPIYAWMGASAIAYRRNL